MAMIGGCPVPQPPLVDDADLSRALRAGDSAEEQAEVSRLRGVAEAVVTAYLGGAENCPIAIQSEAIIRVAAYLYDQPNAGRHLAFANAGRNSGAWSLLAPFRDHRAGAIE